MKKRKDKKPSNDLKVYLLIVLPIVLLILSLLIGISILMIYKSTPSKTPIVQAKKSNVSSKPKPKVDFYINGVKMTREELTKASQPPKDSIFEAIYNNDLELLDRLIEKGTDLEAKNIFKQTALYAATFEKKLLITEKLLQNGANMNAMDNRKTYTPFTWAVSANNIEMVKLFLKYGVDVNYQYKRSQTAIIIAASGCRTPELVKLLLDHGANPNIRDLYNNDVKENLLNTCKKDEKYQQTIALLDNHSLH